MQWQTIVARGVEMRWQQSGEGPGLPIVLVHGIPTCPRLWRHVMPRLESSRCIAWEMVGYGGSIGEGRGRDLSVAHQADYLLHFLDAMEIKQAVLAGHDLGGGVVQILAVNHPDRCAGLLLTNAIGYDSWPIPSVKMLRAAGPILHHLPAGAIRPMMHNLFRRGHDDPDRAEESFREHWPHYQRHGGSALAQQTRWLDQQDTLAVADKLPELDLPARIVWGAADPFQKIEYGERFAKDLRAPLERIEHGRHFTPEDHPDVIADQLAKLAKEAAQAA
ncbi:MAG: alpha/beta fold hydrolase [Phycisphaeraceae bacterium]